MAFTSSLNNLHLSTGQEYNARLDSTLAITQCKISGKYLFLNDNLTLSHVGLNRKIWENMRGIFGFVNHTHRTVLEYHVMQLLVLGAQNKWIEEGDRTKIGQIVKPLLEEKHTPSLYALMKRIEKVQNDSDFQVDFNKYNEIFFKYHQRVLTNISLRTMLSRIVGWLNKPRDHDDEKTTLNFLAVTEESYTAIYKKRLESKALRKSLEIEAAENNKQRAAERERIKKTHEAHMAALDEKKIAVDNENAAKRAELEAKRTELEKKKAELKDALKKPANGNGVS